eukprot:TRINITY_DN20940_c0_g1_i1.p1 TRINITY_DN20940_c0_g1~~TRINITY_DN20940_c0_g1_i1.p1  ORF type:complete len:278 (+),score=33.63 TRINITY_DN20940_c0_g1_i1:62-895(+)
MLLLLAPWTLCLLAQGQSSPPTDHLVVFWDFQEAAGNPRISKAGQYNYALVDSNASNPVDTVTGGVWGKNTAYFHQGQRLTAKREDVPGLANISGKNATVSIVAWIKHEKSAWHAGSLIAGVWNEYKRARQYALFMGLGVCNVAEDVIGHVSAVGGPTPGQKYCTTRACGGTSVPFDEWICVAMTYDGTYAKAYYNGTLDPDGKDNPYYYDKGLYTPPTEAAGADFDVGANIVNTTVGGPPETHNRFAGYMGGLAVYGKALSDQDIRRVCNSPPEWG